MRPKELETKWTWKKDTDVKVIKWERTMDRLIEHKRYKEDEIVYANCIIVLNYIGMMYLLWFSRSICYDFVVILKLCLYLHFTNSPCYTYRADSSSCVCVGYLCVAVTLMWEWVEEWVNHSKYNTPLTVAGCHSGLGSRALHSKEIFHAFWLVWMVAKASSGGSNSSSSTTSILKNTYHNLVANLLKTYNFNLMWPKKGRSGKRISIQTESKSLTNTQWIPWIFLFVCTFCAASFEMIQQK